MTVTVIKNMGASVRQRLLNYARSNGRPFAEVLQYYAMERFLYRLSVSSHADTFILKGALLLRAWHAPISRPTMDIDLLGRTDNATGAIVGLIRDIIQFEVPDDGITFDPQSLSGATIREDADYTGVRTVFTGVVDVARVRMQIDVGFGDVVTPGPRYLNYPTLLDFPGPRLSGYTRETMMAEKLQALVQLGMLNTRLKDYFDLWLLSRQPELDKDILRAAIERTFKNRKMIVETIPVGLTDKFGNDPSKQVQWKAFLKRAKLMNVPDSLVDVVAELRILFEPLLRDIA